MSRQRMVAAVSMGVVALALSGCHTVTRVTTSTQERNGDCFDASLSGDGRWLVFTTFDDPSGVTQPQRTLLRDLSNGSTRELAGSPSGAAPTQSVNADGSRVVFNINSGGGQIVYLWGRASGGRTRISPLGEKNRGAVISADGKKVAYASSGGSKLWLYDIATKTREAIPRPEGASIADPYLDLALSSTGRYVVYRRFPDGGIFVRDMGGSGAWPLLSSIETSTGTATPSISADGRFVAYAKTRKGLLDRSNQVYVWDRTTGVSTRLTTVRSPDLASQPSVSGDGRRITFVTNNLQTRQSRLRVIERSTGKVLWTVAGNSYADGPVMSSDGRRAAYCTPSTNLVSGSPGAPNIYLWTGP